MNLPDITPIKQRLAEVDAKLSDPDTFKNNALASDLSREHQYLGKIVQLHATLLEMQKQLADVDVMLSEETDAEMLELARSEKSKSRKSFRNSIP